MIPSSAFSNRSYQAWIIIVSCCLCVKRTIGAPTWRSTVEDIAFSRIRCFWAFWKTDLDFANFDRYDQYFRNDSVVELAQAGKYVGAANIQEYVQFAFVGENSPYLLPGDTSQRQFSIRFLNYQDGLCEFRMLFKFQYVLNPIYTAAPPPFELVDMVRLYLHREERYFSRVNVFYTNDFLSLFFGVALNSEATRQYVCEQVMGGPCAAELNTTNTTVCISTLQELPTAQGTNQYIDGKSQGCRALHAVFAFANPKQHCAHLSFTPLADPSGNVKCQTSQGTSPSDLFTEADFSTFRRFAEKNGIDPDIGHNCCQNNE